MIKKERLKELIEQESTIYAIRNKKLREINLNKKYYLKNKRLFIFYGEDIPIIKKNIKDLYETKEEAEFVLKYYTKKTIKFEPPTFESIRKSPKITIMKIDDYELQFFFDGIFPSEIRIIKCLDRPTLIKNFGEFTRENYYKALDRMKEIFLEYNGVWYGIK